MLTFPLLLLEIEFNLKRNENCKNIECRERCEVKKEFKIPEENEGSHNQQTYRVEGSQRRRRHVGGFGRHREARRNHLNIKAKTIRGLNVESLKLVLMKKKIINKIGW